MIVKDLAGNDIETDDIRGVTVALVCAYCKGKRRIPGGRYQDQGEVINCPICGGRGTTTTRVSLSLLYDLLNGNVLASSPGPSSEEGSE